MSVVSPVGAGSPATSSQYNGLLAAWDTYTPTAANFTVGNGTLSGRYYRQGKTIAFRITFAAGTTSTYAGAAMTVSLPAPTHASGSQTALLRLSTGGGELLGSGDMVPGGSVLNLSTPTSGSNGLLIAMSSGSPNPGTTGTLIIEGIYEAA